jgi:hypothetical protein
MTMSRMKLEGRGSGEVPLAPSGVFDEFMVMLLL